MHGARECKLYGLDCQYWVKLCTTGKITLAANELIGLLVIVLLRLLIIIDVTF